MGSGFALEIPYGQLLLLVMSLFMFVGAMRGWYREFWSSCFLLALTAILLKPALASGIVGYLSKVLRLIIAFVQGGASLDLNKLASRATKVEIPFDGENPYLFLVMVLLVFVVISYGTRESGQDVTAMSRILGGLMGLFNGFMVLTLFKEYVLQYIRARSPQLAVSAASPNVTIALGDVPRSGLLEGNGLQVLAVVGAAMVVVLIGSVLIGRPIGKR